jgi:hypothetical protein
MTIRAYSLILILISTLPSVSRAAEFGEYVGSVRVEWLGDGRKMKLLEQFRYIDPKKVEWDAPAGWIIDGASIPQFAWSITGGPFEGKYRNASVIHDVACDKKERPWEAVHEAFYNAMRASDVEKAKAKIMYAAVYHFGPRWPLKTTKIVPSFEVEPVIRNARVSEYPGSDVRVTVTEKTRSPYEVMTNQPIKAKVHFDVIPYASQLPKDEFNKLEQEIVEKDLSLEDIRKFRVSPNQ